MPNVYVAVTYHYEICVSKLILVNNMEKSVFKQTELCLVILYQGWEQYVVNYF